MILKIILTIVSKLMSYMFKLLNYTIVFTLGAVVWDYFDIIQFFKIVIA